MSAEENPRRELETPDVERTLAGKELFERAEKALEAANTAAGMVHNLYLTFLLLGTYIGIIIAGTTDEQLLRVSSVTLPLLNVALPILGFYIVTPWLFVLVHFNLLYQYTLLGRKIRVFDRLAAQLPKNDNSALRERLTNFPLVHLLSGLQQDRFMRWVSLLIVWLTLIVLPLGLLLWAQIRFLAFQDSDITWGQRAAVVLDALLLMLFWSRISSSLGAGAWWWQHLLWAYISSVRLLAWPWAVMRSVWKRRWIPPTRRAFGYRRHVSIDSGAGLLIVAVLSTLFVSLIVATVIEEGWEKKVLAYMPESWPTPDEIVKPKRQVFWLTRILFEGEDAFFSRALDLREKVLTGNDLSAETINALREGNPEQRAQALQKVLGMNLQGRDLRYANLVGSILPKVDLRGAQLQGAGLLAARLQGAHLRFARLQGANLRGAQLQGADLRGASIGGSDFENASFDFANLSRLDRTELTQNDYQELSRVLERRVDDQELLATILERLKPVIGQKDTLNKAKSAKQCLAHDPELIDLGCTNQPTQYYVELGDYWVKLACTDPHVARGVSRRLSQIEPTDQAAGLATAFLKADCAPLQELSESIKEHLKKVASGD